MLKENLVEYIYNSIVSHKSSPAFSDYNGKTFTYQEVGQKIQMLHGLFLEQGVKTGDKISLVAKNSSHWTIIYLAAVTYGAVIVPVLPEFKEQEITNIVNHSDSVLLFVGEMWKEKLDYNEMPALKGVLSVENLQRVHGLSPAESKTDFTEKPLSFPEVPNNALAVISYTSGTTGFSKGVMLLHNSLSANIKYARENMPLNAGDAIVSFLPLAHAYGCAFEFLFPFTLGCHITFLTKTPSPGIIVEAFGKIKPRLILSVPLVIEKIFKKQILPAIEAYPVKLLIRIPLLNKLIYKKIYKKLAGVFGGNFRELIIGGAPFNADAEKFFRKIGFPYTVGYGMTECGPLITYASWKTIKYRSSGRPVDTLELKIDSNDPYTKVGEIMVRGDNVMEGYYKDKDATKKVFDNDGWLHTGDLGVIDQQKNLFIKGRSKSMLLGPSGQNIYPEEIESRINNLPHVAESVVITRNNKLTALIFPDQEIIEKEKLDEETLKTVLNQDRKRLNNELPAYMNVSEFALHEHEFEKTPKRSIKRFIYT